MFQVRGTFYSVLSRERGRGRFLTITVDLVYKASCMFKLDLSLPHTNSPPLYCSRGDH